MQTIILKSYANNVRKKKNNMSIEEILIKTYPYFSSFDTVAEAIIFYQKADKDTLFGKTIAITGALAKAATGTLGNYFSFDEILETLGYKSHESGLKNLTCQLLLEHFPYKVVKDQKRDKKAYFFKIKSNKINLVIYQYNRRESILYYSKSIDIEEILTYLFKTTIWKNGNTIFLSHKAENTFGIIQDSIQLTYLKNTEQIFYINSEIDLTKIQRRFATAKGNRSILLIGPTGSGKTSLANYLTRNLNKENPTSVRLSKDIVSRNNLEEIIQFLDIVKPGLLIIDDIPLRSSEELLESLEILHKFIPLIICTFMDEEYSIRKDTESSLYFPGMRPGRIDEIIRIPPPLLKDREAIIELYIDKTKNQITHEQITKLAQETKGLTPAYLQELCYRINHYSIEFWEEELETIKQMAQIFEVKD